MRVAILVGAAALVASAFSANAAPAVPSPLSEPGNIVHVAGGCGPGGHPNRWGHCAPNRYGHYDGPRRYGWYGSRHWSSPGDHVANHLNRRELYSGSTTPHHGHGWGY